MVIKARKITYLQPETGGDREYHYNPGQYFFIQFILCFVFIKKIGYFYPSYPSYLLRTARVLFSLVY